MDDSPQKRGHASILALTTGRAAEKKDCSITFNLSFIRLAM
jgi:hypothetical protein